MVRSLFAFWGKMFFLVMMLSGSLQAASLPDFTELVEKHSPAVVNISTTGTQKAAGRGGMPPELEQMPELFRHFFGAPFGGDAMPKESRSMGSGFIVSEDGIILTNNHVIDGADEIVVRLNDRRELSAKLIGSDPRSDLAVLKIEAQDLPVVKMGHSDQLRVGEWVFAIGSPFGFDYTVTAGIVSAIGRNLPNENYVPFIQTDVAINPGNSGGPLFNMKGEVVGINSQIYTRSGGFMGVSFAIPVDVAMNVVDQLKQKGYVSRGWLGVLIQEVNKELAESFGLDKPHGALVAQVVPDSPAEAAGIKTGDIITHYQAREISRSSDLPHLVGTTPVGNSAELKVLRGGKEKTLTVKIGELPNESGEKAVPATLGKELNNRLNMQVAALDDQAKNRLGVTDGVLVVKVAEGPARRAGIRPNDVIASINNQEVKNVKQFEKVVSDLPAGKAAPVLVIRQGNPLFVVIKLGD